MLKVYLVLLLEDFSTKRLELKFGNNILGRGTFDSSILANFGVTVMETNTDSSSSSATEGVNFINLEEFDSQSRISQHHLLINLNSSGVITAKDLNSLNGTYLNKDERLNPGEQVKLTNGDELIIGRIMINLQVQRAASL